MSAPYTKTMALLRYFKKKDDLQLPNPNGPLSSRMPSVAIAAANREVKELVSCASDAENAADTQKTSRGQYLSYTDKERARIAKRASEFGVTNTIRHFSKEFADRPLKESTVRTWMPKYRQELANRVKLGKNLTIKELQTKKRGHPYMLGEEMDRQLQEYVKSLRESKTVVNSTIVLSAAEGIVKSHDSGLLACNGGHIKCTKQWAKHFLTRLGYVRRKATTKASLSDIDFEAQKYQFLFDIQTIIEMEEIPSELVINWDHTGVHYVPASNWTMEKKGLNRIEVAGLDDKRQITLILEHQCLETSFHHR